MEKRFISDLKIGDAVWSDFLVTEKALVAFSQPNRAGEQFLRLQLTDISGSVRAVAWDKGPELALKFGVGDIVRVRGEVGEYKGPQLVIYSVDPVPPEQVDRRQFQRTAPGDRGEMLAELEKVLVQIDNPWLARLMEHFFTDKEFLRRFTESPAARTVHHNYVGGLLEHSLEVASYCSHFASVYPSLDRSLLLCGALLHDAGKIEEYDALSLTFDLTTKGKLLGHIMIGKTMLDQRVAEIPGFPEVLYLELAHMILSHHGQKEWGSPEIPRTFAAFALFHADLVSARLNLFAQVAAKGGKEDGWTEWNRLLERDVFVRVAE